MGTLSNQLLNVRIWDRLSRIQRIMGWDDHELADRLGYTVRELRKKRVARKAILATPMVEMAQSLGVDPNEWLMGRFDFAAFEKQAGGDVLCLPERYSVGAFSRRRTSLHLVAYCDAKYGDDFTDQLLSEMQVRRLALEQADDFISLTFLMDLASKLKSRGVCDRTLMEMGCMSSTVNTCGPLGEKIRQCRSPQEAYDRLINELVTLFDFNFRYRLIELTSNHCVIESEDLSSVRDALGLRRLGSKAVCQTRKGVAASVTAFLGFPPASVEHVTCQHDGDLSCRFYVEFGRWSRRMRLAASPPKKTE